MADETPKDNSPKTEPTHLETSEDAETRAARRELKQSSISDSDKASAAVTGDDKAEDPSTPTPDTSIVQNDEEKVLSPKKKRSHDQLGEDKDTDNNDATSTTSTDSAKDRASRLEPEKKRHREGEAGNAPSVSSSCFAVAAQLPSMQLNPFLNICYRIKPQPSPIRSKYNLAALLRKRRYKHQLAHLLPRDLDNYPRHLRLLQH